ncbi:MAG: hypothetical protein M3209_00155 [Acidobacteriota bacterium]|nr:hypothetical protein [Acidobacteriota bacterium]
MIADLPANPHLIVNINGRIFDSWDKDPQEVMSCSVELVTNRSSQCHFKVFDPEFRIADEFAWIAGGGTASILVFMGYGRSLGPPIFKGIVAHIERDDASTGFVAYDTGFKMKRVKNAEYYYKKDDRDIIGILAARNGLIFSPPPDAKGLEKYKVMTQDEKNDWQMSMERAREMGWNLYVRGDTLFARYPARVEAPKAVYVNRKDFRLKHGFDFTFRIPESQEGKKLVQRVGRGRGGKRLIGESDVSRRGKENVNLKRDTPGKHTKAKLEVRAQAQKDLEREHAFESSIKVAVDPSGARLDVRDTVRVQNVGALFSGDYICDGVRYEFAAGRLEMDLDLYRDIN